MKKVIGLVAALPNEVKPCLTFFGACRGEKLGKFKIYHLSSPDYNCVVIQSGMGTQNAAEATSALITSFDPSVIINFGFAGAILPGLAVGDIIVAGRILLHRDRLFSEQEGITETTRKRVTIAIDEALLQHKCQVVTGTFITAGKQLRKMDVAKLLPQKVVHPVLEMESSAVARVAAKKGIPFLALRAITDTSEQELSFDITEITNRRKEVSVVKLLVTVVKKPWILRQLPVLASNAREAGKNLAIALVAAATASVDDGT